MSHARPEDVPPEWLAAYADGELAPEQRAEVERWLTENPELRELLEAQESLGPGNTEFWNSVRPPAPSARQWNDAVDGARRANPIGLARRYGWIGTIGLVATAATLLLALPGPRPCLPPADERPPENRVLPSDDEPFLMASEDELRIISLPESAAALLVVGEHPLRDSLLVLARAGEVEFFGIGSDIAGRFPSMPSTDPSDPEAPMIWTPREP